mmetsp:Transcript_87779/g.154857  ORF Transcript_87779/g.154857 Transcript_87779/m.154857 type:complete len:112 (-) Transcript_87779:981-1316(-)
MDTLRAPLSEPAEGLCSNPVKEGDLPPSAPISGPIVEVLRASVETLGLRKPPVLGDAGKALRVCKVGMGMPLGVTTTERLPPFKAEGNIMLLFFRCARLSGDADVSGLSTF